jgi:hypothetical protein
VSTPRKPRLPSSAPANDNVKPKKRRLPQAEVRLPPGMPVQLLEAEVVAELLNSLPPPDNDNGE